MLKIDFTNEMTFGFTGPNLCLLGDEAHCRKLSELLLQLMDDTKPNCIDINELDFSNIRREKKKYSFAQKRSQFFRCFQF